MEQTFGESGDFGPLDDTDETTQDETARGVFYGLVFSLPIWIVIVALVAAAT
jgi:hypothetical protein